MLAHAPESGAHAIPRPIGAIRQAARIDFRGSHHARFCFFPLLAPLGYCNCSHHHWRPNASSFQHPLRTWPRRARMLEPHRMRRLLGPGTRGCCSLSHCSLQSAGDLWAVGRRSAAGVRSLCKRRLGGLHRLSPRHTVTRRRRSRLSAATGAADSWSRHTKVSRRRTTSPRAAKATGRRRNGCCKRSASSTRISTARVGTQTLWISIRRRSPARSRSRCSTTSRRRCW